MKRLEPMISHLQEIRMNMPSFLRPFCFSSTFTKEGNLPSGPFHKQRHHFLEEGVKK